MNDYILSVAATVLKFQWQSHLVERCQFNIIIGKKLYLQDFTMVKWNLMAWYASKVWRKGFLTFSRNNFERKCEQSVRMVFILLG